MTTVAPARRFTGDFRADVLVLVVAVVALVAAFIYETSLGGQTAQFKDPNSGLTLAIPNNWTVNSTQDPEVFVSAYDTRADSVFKSSITGRSFALDTEQPADLDTIVDGLIADHQNTLQVFHLFDTKTVTLAGNEGRAIHYAYVTQPIDQAFSDSPPVIVIATDYVVYSPGKEYWVLTQAADEKIADREQSDFQTIIKSIRLPQ